jgi:hypothetical protein
MLQPSQIINDLEMVAGYARASDGGSLLLIMEGTMFKRNLLSGLRPMAPLTATLFAAVAIGSNAAHAGSVTFDWQQIGGSLPATGTLTLTSSLLTPSDATGAAQFSLMLAQIVAAGETVLGDVSAFTFSFAGQTLSTSDMKSNSTGWADMYPDEPNNILESTWSASHTFSNGTLQVVGNSTPTSYGDLVTATMGTQSATGEWLLVPKVPLPASIWTLLGGIALLFGSMRARQRLLV